MMVLVLSLWFALPDVAHAQTITIEGRNIYVSFTASLSSATATITYTEGSGQVEASVTGFAHFIDRPSVILSEALYDNSSNPTPGGASAGVSAPSGCSFFSIMSSCKYEVYINGTTYKGEIPYRKDFE